MFVENFLTLACEFKVWSIKIFQQSLSNFRSLVRWSHVLCYKHPNKRTWIVPCSVSFSPNVIYKCCWFCFTIQRLLHVLLSQIPDFKIPQRPISCGFIKEIGYPDSHIPPTHSLPFQKQSPCKRTINQLSRTQWYCQENLRRKPFKFHGINLSPWPTFSWVSGEYNSHANSSPSLRVLWKLHFICLVICSHCVAGSGLLAPCTFYWGGHSSCLTPFQVQLNFLYKGNENVLYLIQQHITRGLVITQRAVIFFFSFSYYSEVEISKHFF